MAQQQTQPQDRVSARRDGDTPFGLPAHPGRVLAAALIAVIRLWQWTISAVSAPSCRVSPSCSHYGIEAIRVHGPLRGSWLTVRRLLRCHPWGGYGIDPVPQKHAAHIHEEPGSRP